MGQPFGTLLGNTGFHLTATSIRVHGYGHHHSMTFRDIMTRHIEPQKTFFNMAPSVFTEFERKFHSKNISLVYSNISQKCMDNK